MFIFKKSFLIKTAALFALLSLLTTCFGCTNNETTQSGSEYIYCIIPYGFTVFSPYEGQREIFADRLCRVNVNTGSVTLLCNDPSCDHISADCTAICSGTYDISPGRNTVAYYRSGYDSRHEAQSLMVYNAETGEIKKSRSSPSTIKTTLSLWTTEYCTAIQPSQASTK